ncbi:MAG: FecR family protein, partial [Burkholderiales bacterium]
MNQDSPRRSIQEEAHTWFVRLRSDQAGEADRGAFSGWLAADPEHARAYAEGERLWQWLEAPGRLAHGRGVARLRRVRALRRAVVGLPLAACLLLAGWPWVAEGLRPWRSDFVTGWGETQDIVLADGSHVTLNSHSGLDLAFDGKRRGVRLTEGEAYFEVVKDVARPFVVAALHGEVTVLGTRFNVYDESARVTVTVAEGRVRVASGGGEAVLSAGRQTAYSTAGVGPVSVANADEALAWRRGRLVFKL